MDTFKIIYEYCYPEAENDIKTAYVLAKDFNDAQCKVERNKKGEFESASIKSIEKIDAEIFI